MFLTKMQDQLLKIWKMIVASVNLGQRTNFEQSKCIGVIGMGVGRVPGWYFVRICLASISFYDRRATLEGFDWRRGFLGLSHRK